MSHLDTLRRKAAGLLVVRLGSNMNPPRRAEEDVAGVRALLEHYPVGGLILFNGHWPETRETLSDLQRISERPLLVMTDMERGLGQQVAGATTFPHLRALGEIGDEDLVQDFARVSAREALACGIHVALAPVVDVNRNPRNPIISTRAFGDDTTRVSLLSAAYVRGLRAEGLLATAKHFPGHGNTAEDSHATLPTVEDTLDELERFDLPPFVSAFDAGAELVMTAHVAYPSLDGSGLPATLSHPILHGLLRQRMGFEGAIISDSLHMAGIRPEGRGEGEIAADQVIAGVDLLLDPQDPEAVLDGIASAVQQGRLSEDRLDQALMTAQRLRTLLTDRFGGRLWTEPSSAVAPGEVASRGHRELAARIASAAVRVEGDAATGSGEGLLVVLVRSRRSHLDPEELPLGNALREHLPGVDYRELDPDSTQDARDTTLEAAERARAVVLAMVVKPAAWQEFGLPAELQELGKQIVAGRHAVVASLGDPRALDAFPEAQGRIVTFSDTPASQKALAEVLAGYRDQ